ncbi:hypothetical protein ARMSODRAFT_981936 [Armillaria solidipes]|uniref:Uncharacterized protein n=1 Tax=Armillaria solidipes TaxID=1076256 RepID=A0A2H3AVT4_9AGAR|nr:hypothetical protein ARMSODRAFT_981936 [Armillaria solidipes]
MNQLECDLREREPRYKVSWGFGGLGGDQVSPTEEAGDPGVREVLDWLTARCVKRQTNEPEQLSNIKGAGGRVAKLRGLRDEVEDEEWSGSTGAAKHGERLLYNQIKQSAPLHSAYSLARHKLDARYERLELAIQRSILAFRFFLAGKLRPESAKTREGAGSLRVETVLIRTSVVETANSRDILEVGGKAESLQDPGDMTPETQMGRHQDCWYDCRRRKVMHPR